MSPKLFNQILSTFDEILSRYDFWVNPEDRKKFAEEFESYLDTMEITIDEWIDISWNWPSNPLYYSPC
jgi:hypothetical protein